MQHGRAAVTTGARLLGPFELGDEFPHLRQRQDLTRPDRGVAGGTDRNRIEPRIARSSFGQFLQDFVDAVANVDTTNQRRYLPDGDGLAAEALDLEPEIAQFLDRSLERTHLLGRQLDYKRVEQRLHINCVRLHLSQDLLVHHTFVRGMLIDHEHAFGTLGNDVGAANLAQHAHDRDT